MKPWNIILFFTICLQLAAYVVANVVVFDNVNYEYSSYAIQYGEPTVGKYSIENVQTDFGGVTGASTGSITDLVSSGVFMASAMAFILGAIASIVWMYPVLINTFHIPQFWSGVFQVVIYIIYAIGIFSWISGRHPDATL